MFLLQEVEHFDFFKNWLGTTGFASFFMAKPNSPCLNIPDNNGPDGCAIFFNQNKFELIDLDEHVLEVFGTAANQVKDFDLNSWSGRSKALKSE